DGNEVRFDLAEDLTVGSVTAGDTVLNADGVKVGDNVALTSDGLKAGNVTVDAASGRISGVEAGTDANDAVNVAQLNAAAAAATNKVAAGDNIEVGETQNDDGSTTYTVATAKDLVVDSVKAGDTVLNADGVKVGDNVALTSDGLKAGNVTVTAAGIDAGGKTIRNVADGAVSADSKEAVNGSQLYATNQNVAQNTADIATNAANIAKGINIGGTSGSNNYALGDTVNIKGDGNISSETVAGGVQLKLADSVTIGTDNPVTVDGTAGTVTGLSNTAFDADNIVSGRAATEDQLKQVSDVANAGWSLTAQGQNGSNVKPGATVDLRNNDGNIVVAKSADADTVTFDLAKAISVDSVTAGDTVLNADGVSVGDNVALTSDGLKAGNVTVDAASGKISGVEAGTDANDAVNVAQLNAAAAAATNKVAAGDNIEVAETQNDDGSTTYTVATAKNVVFDSVSAGEGANRVVLDDAGVSVGGNTYITGSGINANNQVIRNVAAGSIAAGSTDAVNGGQLYNTAASVANVFGGNASVNPDGSVSMSNVGGTGADNVNDAIQIANQAAQAAGQAAVEAKTTVSAGDNIVVVQSPNADGSTNYTVSTAKDLTVDSVKAGDTVVSGSGLTIAGGPSVTAGGLDAGGKKITNVADGEISATSKDAINGSQLYQAYQVLGGNNSAVNTVAAPATQNADGSTTPAGTVVTVVTNADGSTATTTETNQTVAVSTDKGGNQYTLTTYNVEGQNTYVTNDVIQAVGKMNEQGIKFFHTNDGEVEPVVQGHNDVDSSASGSYATAIGYQASASGNNAVVLGNTYTAADENGNTVEQRAQASGTNAIAIGSGAQATAENTIAIGTGNIVSGRNSGAIGDPSTVSGSGSYSLGNNNIVSTDNTFVVGNNVTQTMENSVVLGNRSSATAVHTTANGGNYTFAGANDANVAGVNDVVGVVSVGTEGETRQIQNVAAGVVSATSTDAINGSQLHYTNEAINSVANYTVNMGNQLNQRIDGVEKRSNAGTATAMAVAGLPQAYLPGKSMVAVAGGTYRGESGYAVGYSSISDNGNWVIKGSATGNSRGHYGATAGVGYQW
ncbi:YadA-like family protein, partial [Neisseria sp.]|uniref:YadA-like family protein n=1 Tax=Neisseria sp. TaxID=192066 RepID=UPI0026DD3747